MNVQGDNLLIEVLKWVGIVFAAGFIGYFGRYLSMLIIEKTHRKKSQSTPVSGTSAEITAAPETTPENVQLEIEKQKARLEKKKAKAEAKRLKKESKN